ncbi:MAG: ABC transporter substrate-binding protein [Lachnospiraceae bacterium]|nr:ABC transporter substrate-binding protein [Lachnospiraceae bacterium]
MRLMKRVMAVVLSGMMAASLAACGSGEGSSTTTTTAPAAADAATTAPTVEADTPAPAAPGEKVVRIAASSDPGSLGTFDEGSSSGRWNVLSYTYETLLSLEPDGSFGSMLAKSYKKLPEKSTPTHVVYEIELYDYIKDSAGNPITADDVVFSYEECLNNGSGNQHTALTGNMDSIEKTGDYTVELACNKEAAGAVERMMSRVHVVSKKAYEESGDCMRTQPVGTGAYLVESWVTGSSLTLVKNEDYWQKEELRGDFQKQNADRIEYYFVTEAAQTAIGLETGSYDVVTTLNYTNAARFMEGGASSEGFAVTRLRDSIIQQMWVNRSEDSPLHDLRIAQAVLYAIDVDALIQVVMEGHGEPEYCYGSDISIGYQEKWATEPYYQYDPDKAKALLDEAGYKPGDFTLTILCDTDEVRSKTAQTIQLLLADVGIQSEVTSFEQALWNTYQTDTEKFDLNISYNTTSGHITALWNQLNSQQYAEHNMAGVRDDKLDSLLDQAAISQDPADIDAAKQYMTEQAYHYSLFHKQANYVTNSNVVREPVFDTRGNFVPTASVYTWN